MNRTQHGSSLIEVLVTILLLSFGMLALGGMMSYAVQMPKLAGFRSSATSIAAGLIERMRANPQELFYYTSTSAEPHTFNDDAWLNHWLGSVSSTCSYSTSNGALPPGCISGSTDATKRISTIDLIETHDALRRELPGFAGLRITCSGGGTCAASNYEGDLWVMWSEPSTFASVDAGTSDECPLPGDTPTFTAFSSPKPRCLHVRFKLYGS